MPKLDDRLPAPLVCPLRFVSPTGGACAASASSGKSVLLLRRQRETDGRGEEASCGSVASEPSRSPRRRGLVARLRKARNEVREEVRSCLPCEVPERLASEGLAEAPAVESRRAGGCGTFMGSAGACICGECRACELKLLREGFERYPTSPSGSSGVAVRASMWLLRRIEPVLCSNVPREDVGRLAVLSRLAESATALYSTLLLRLEVREPSMLSVSVSSPLALAAAPSSTCTSLPSSVPPSLVRSSASSSVSSPPRLLCAPLILLCALEPDKLGVRLRELLELAEEKRERQDETSLCMAKRAERSVISL